LFDIADSLDSQRVPVNQAERAGRPGAVPYYGATGRVGWIDRPLFSEELCLLGEDGAPFLDRSKSKAYLIDGPSWVNNHAHVLRALGGITSNRFLKYALDHVDYTPFVNGTTRLKLTKAAMRRIRIPLPPLAEQARIVAALEEQFSLLEAAESSLGVARRRLDQLRSSVLAQLITAPWPLTRVADVATVGSGSTPKRGEPRYWDNGTVPWVTSGQLNQPFVREPAALISEQALQETSVKLWPRGTLLVAMYGEGKTRGHCSELMIEATTNQACAAIALRDESVDRSYLKWFFAASYDANRRLASGGVQPNLSLGLIKNIRFPHPPLHEQQRIVAEIERRLSFSDALVRAIEGASMRAIMLRRSILGSAVAGKLVAQDPSDEPAEALLVRIAAARASERKIARRRHQVSS
jgi:type I restriction enzyme S subunit